MRKPTCRVQQLLCNVDSVRDGTIWSITIRIGTIFPSRAFAPTSAVVPFGNKEEMP